MTLTKEQVEQCRSQLTALTLDAAKPGGMFTMLQPEWSNRVNALCDLALQAIDMRPRQTVQWHGGKEIPAVAKGYDKALIVAVRRGSNGKAYVFPACYLNAMPLEYPRECICENEDDHDDGCPTSGWFTIATSNGYDSGVYEALLYPDDELLAWAELPEFDETMLSALPTGGE